MKKIEKAIVVLAGAAGLHWIIKTLHRVATIDRGFDAIGGEYMLILIPFIAYMLYRSVKDIRESMK